MTPDFRTYHDVTGDDRSGLLEQVGRQRERVRARLADVSRVVAVMSGKGGVGKSHVTAGLAYAVATRGEGAVGVLDADLQAPTAARLLDARGPVRVGDDGAEPVMGAGGVRVFSMDLLLAEGQPLRWREPESERFVWRGTLETGALREFLSDVRWGALEVLLIDLPPGAAHLADLKSLVPALTGAVAVTIPSEESRRAVERAIRAAGDAGIRLLGVVENLSGYACAGCDSTQPLFPGDAGASLARAFGAPLLGRIPFTPAPPPADESGRVWPPPPARSAAVAVPPVVPSSLVDAFLEALS